MVSAQLILYLHTTDIRKDAVSSVQLHPYYPLLLTSSGSRNMTVSGSSLDNGSSEGSQSDSDSDDSDSGLENENSKSMTTPRSKIKDSTMKVWSFLPSTTST